MRTALLALLLLPNLADITYMQYYRVESPDAKRTDNNFVYENDTVKVTYSFWGNGGVMSFVIFNKTDRPLYIDWSRSSMIVNSNNTFYYNDSLAAVSYNQTAVGFLPPKTQIKQSISPMVTRNISDWSNFETQYQIRNDTRKTETKIFSRQFSKDKSPVIFRNFLTLSDHQDFQNSFFVDNAFYVAEVQAMDVRNFMKQKSDNLWEFFYKRGTDFYFYR